MSAWETIRAAFRSPAIKGAWPVVLASPLLIVLSGYLAVTPIGTCSLLHGQAIFALGLLGAVLAIPVLPFLLFSKKFRIHALAWLFVCVIYAALTILGFGVGNKIRMRAFDDLAKRSQPLVKAIEDFTAAHGSPPPSLKNLVPDYLAAVPKTRMMSFPDYKYKVGKEAQRYEGNPWILSVPAPSGGINFDEFYYFPLQNYPRNGYGGSLERIRNWAYLHE